MGKKSSLDQLTANQKKALAHFYGTDAYKALERLGELEVQGLGADALISPNQDHTKWLQGRSSWAVDQLKLIRQLYKEDAQQNG